MELVPLVFFIRSKDTVPYFYKAQNPVEHVRRSEEHKVVHHFFHADSNLRRIPNMDRGQKTKKRILEASPTSSKLERRGSLRTPTLRDPQKCLLGAVKGFSAIFVFFFTIF